MKRFRSITLDPINTITWTGILVVSILFAVGLASVVI